MVSFALLTRGDLIGVGYIRGREYESCGQKIQYFLNFEYGIHLSVPKIYEILAEKYIIRSEVV